MRNDVCAILKEVNRQFYNQFAVEFAESRASTEPGLQRALALVDPGSRVLDLGCGHGRVRALLPEGCYYTGVDFSLSMMAQSNLAVDERAHFVEADLTQLDWLAQVTGPFAWIIIRAVLHHIPGYEHRLALLSRARRLLSRDGHLLVANWQFLEIPRLRRRILPWTTIGLNQALVEDGDFLLDWKRGGIGIRYVHLVDEAETQLLASDAGLTIDMLYRADGYRDRLTLYALMSEPSR